MDQILIEQTNPTLSSLHRRKWRIRQGKGSRITSGDSCFEAATQALPRRTKGIQGHIKPDQLLIEATSLGPSRPLRRRLHSLRNMRLNHSLPFAGPLTNHTASYICPRGGIMNKHRERECSNERFLVPELPRGLHPKESLDAHFALTNEKVCFCCCCTSPRAYCDEEEFRRKQLEIQGAFSQGSIRLNRRTNEDSMILMRPIRPRVSDGSRLNRLKHVFFPDETPDTRSCIESTGVEIIFPWGQKEGMIPMHSSIHPEK